MQLRGSRIIKRRGVEGSLGYWGCGFAHIWRSDLFQLSFASPMWDERFGSASCLSLASLQTHSKQGQLLMDWNCRSRVKTALSSLELNYPGHFSFARMETSLVQVVKVKMNSLNLALGGLVRWHITSDLTLLHAVRIRKWISWAWQVYPWPLGHLERPLPALQTWTLGSYHLLSDSYLLQT